jgi:CheY-like chemotaxis protein
MLSMNDAGYLMSKRILVADDSLTIQKAFAMVMDGSDYVLSFAKSVDEALAATKSNGRPDLVLSDVVLGNGSGYDLCAEIKAEPTLRDVPVYILASSQTPYDEARGRKVGADGHLAKPFESQALLDAVASAIASPARPISAVMPQFSADYDDNTARISNKDLPDLDDDSYGEITIERSPVPPTAASTWAAKPPTRPSGVRPIPAPSPAPSPAAPSSPRPSLIPGARPSAGMPAVRSGLTPQPSTSAPVPAAARPPMNRTMMGFPSVKPPVASKPAVPSPPAAPRLTPAAPMAVVPSHPVAATISPPLEGPVTVKAPTPLPPTATSAAPAAIARPVVPRFAPPPPPAAPVLATTPVAVARPATSPVPAKTPDTAAPPLAATVASAVDRKVATLAARGPEYEAIAKLSREIIEQVVWEVVPELAEAIIRQEVDRLASAKK